MENAVVDSVKSVEGIEDVELYDRLNEYYKDTPPVTIAQLENAISHHKKIREEAISFADTVLQIEQQAEESFNFAKNVLTHDSTIKLHENDLAYYEHLTEMLSKFIYLTSLNISSFEFSLEEMKYEEERVLN